MLVPRSVPPAAGILLPNVSFPAPGFVIEYLNQPVVASFLGLLVPFIVAEALVIVLAATVETVGIDTNGLLMYFSQN